MHKASRCSKTFERGKPRCQAWAYSLSIHSTCSSVDIENREQWWEKPRGGVIGLKIRNIFSTN